MFSICGDADVAPVCVLNVGRNSYFCVIDPFALDEVGQFMETLMLITPINYTYFRRESNINRDLVR